MIIHPEIIVTPDQPTIRFRESFDEVDLERELPKILRNQGWGVGTYFHVQFLDFKRTRLLNSATFLVTEESETLHTSDDPYQPVTRTLNERKAQRITDWWPGRDLSVEESTEEQEKICEEILPEFVQPLKVVWNPGRKTHEVKRGKQVVFASEEKLHAIRVSENKNPLTGHFIK